ncbi:hypothetical protein D9M69_463660 [compost metagenome]
MSAYTLTGAAEAVLADLVERGGGSSILLSRPAETIHANVCIEQAGAAMEAVVLLGPTTNRLTLQTGDSANIQHLVEFIESIANGTLETAAAPSAPAYVEHTLLPCHKCKGEAIGFDYCAPGPGTRFLHGAKCRYGDCQQIMDCESAGAAARHWNAIQAEAADHSVDATDMVNHPPHYTGHPSGIECIQVAEHLPFCLGNAFKYLFRRNGKNKASENIEKAIWYVNRHIETWIDWEGRLPDDVRWDLGLIVTHEPHPIGAAMLIIAGEPQCGGYEACVELLQRELERVRRVEAHA